MLRINNLNGFGGNAGVFTTLTYVGSAGAQATSVTIPSSALAGDIAVLLNGARGSGIPTAVTPSGWGNLVNASDGTTPARMEVHYKILTSGDPGSSVTGMDGNTGETLLVLVFRPNAPITTITPSTFNSQITNFDPTLQTVSASGQTSPVLVVGGLMMGTDTTPAFSTETPAFTASVTQAGSSSNPHLLMGYTIYAKGSSPSNHSLDKADQGFNNGLWSGYFTLT